jgi:DNA invertase Pin-like site-specific DNA recombinase
LRRERQLEGIAKAKKAGVYKGRPPSIDAGAVQRLRTDRLGATEIARRLSISRASVHRILSATS